MIDCVAHYFRPLLESSNSACPSRLVRSYRPWVATPISRQHLGASPVPLTWGPGNPALGQPKGVTPSASKRVYSCSIPNHGTYSFTWYIAIGVPSYRTRVGCGRVRVRTPLRFCDTGDCSGTARLVFFGVLLSDIQHIMCVLSSVCVYVYICNI